jgi:ubiquinol-cytochrome c reductase cytochrome c subunit
VTTLGTALRRYRFVVAAVTGVALCLGLAACDPGADPPHVGPREMIDAVDEIEEPLPPLPDDDVHDEEFLDRARDDVLRGRALYATSCAWCHGQLAEGTQYAPGLTHVGESSADFWLSTGRMPIASPHERPRRSEALLTQDDIDALVGYIGALGDGPEIPTVREGDIHLGMAVYLNSCATCHSASGAGGALPRGDFAPSLVHSTPTQLAQGTRLGPGSMPSFGAHAMSDDELDAVVTYILAMRETHHHGGHSLGAYGPSVEGVVGWVVGLGLLLVVARMLGRSTT